MGDEIEASGPPPAAGNLANNPHVRRKSTLPIDPQVLRDLQAHRSLEGENGM
jgi:serine/threonine-protein phosphatase 2A regulatory subunit B'